MLTCRNGIIFILIFLLSLCCLSDSSAHDEDVTHREITAFAIERSSLANYFIYNFGILEGTKKALGYNENYLMIEQWLQEGSKLEDDLTCSASNHFHDPLDPWNLSYMSDEPWYVSLWCDVTGYATRYSNIPGGQVSNRPTDPRRDGCSLEVQWEGMKGALSQGNINQALNYFVTNSREEYREIFETLAPQLPALVSAMREINMVEIKGNLAEYYIKRFQRGVDISYFIYFMRDENGVWRISSF